jgi:putative NADH-flavin reductase
MRIVVFGANGPTGRQLVDQALAAGHKVAAVTRRPDDIPPRDRLTVVGADVTDADAVEAVIAGSDAVLSALGVSFSRKPITVYSLGATNIIAAMHQHAVPRLVIVSSATLDPAYRPSDSFFFNRVMDPLFRTRPGRTLYDDLRRMEALVRVSDLDWTIIRPTWLFNTAAVTDYQLAENSADGMYTARADLAASMLAQLTDDRFVHKAIGVITTAVKPNIIQQIWHESIKKAKKKPPGRRTPARRWARCSLKRSASQSCSSIGHILWSRSVIVVTHESRPM